MGQTGWWPGDILFSKVATMTKFVLFLAIFSETKCLPYPNPQ